MLSDFDKLNDHSLRYYEESLKKYGDTPQGMNWSSEESQILRFNQLLSIADLNNKSLHDVGCGSGRLYDHIKDKYPTCDYVGSDISALMVDVATSRINNQKNNIHVANILNDDWEWMRCDYLVNSGIFTVKQNSLEDSWRKFVYKMIDRMYELSIMGIGFNMMSSYVDYREDHLFYSSPHEVMDYCITNLSRKVKIYHHYNLFEFTVFVYK